MFRAAQQNPFDDPVGRATDENLTSENWEYIIDVVDKVQSSDSGAKDATAAMIKRLAHRNANVQIYTLELANSLSQNCGKKVQRELASRSFTDALLRLAGDRNTHGQVKAKILERMAEWTETYSADPELGIMEQAYQRLKSQNPSLHPPSKPYKQEITDADRRKEEEELQMALALSIKDKGTAASGRKQSAGVSSAAAAAEPSSSTVQQQQQQPAVASPSAQTGQTAATVSRVRAKFDFQPSEPGELQFRRGDVITVIASAYKDWWKGSLRGQEGIFPLNYVDKLADPTPEELQREAEMEAEVFAQIKNVEKLLTLLSTSSGTGNERDNEEITTLYHSTLAIRPKLIQLINKYSQKKDEFSSLNEKFLKALHDYEQMLGAAISQPQQGYGRPPPPSQFGYGTGAPSGPPQGQGNFPPAQDFYQQPQQQSIPQQSQFSQPQSGPAPFYFNPASTQQPPAALQTQVPTGQQDGRVQGQKPMSPGPTAGPPGAASFPPGGPSRLSTHELAASSLESPMQNMSLGQQPQFDYGHDPYANSTPAGQYPPQQQGPYSQFAPATQQAHPPQPGHAAPGPPGVVHSPPPQQQPPGQYQPLAPQASGGAPHPPQQQYTSYSPPPQQYAQPAYGQIQQQHSGGYQQPTYQAYVPPGGAVRSLSGDGEDFYK